MLDDPRSSLVIFVGRKRHKWRHKPRGISGLIDRRRWKIAEGSEKKGRKRDAKREGERGENDSLEKTEEEEEVIAGGGSWRGETVQ